MKIKRHIKLIVDDSFVAILPTIAYQRKNIADQDMLYCIFIF